MTLVSLVKRNVLVHAQRPAIVLRSGSISWRDFGERVAKAAAVLARLGVGPGDRFAIVAKNSVCQFELLHAGYWCGAIPVPVNWRLAPVELAQVLEDSTAKLVAVDSANAELFTSNALNTWEGKVMLAEGEERPGRFHYLSLMEEVRPLV